jgi:hypothetical protein
MKVQQSQKLLLIFVFQILKVVYAYLLVKMFDFLDTVSKSYFLETFPSYKIWGSQGGDYKDSHLLGCDACSLVESYPPNYTASYPTKTMTFLTCPVMARTSKHGKWWYSAQHNCESYSRPGLTYPWQRTSSYSTNWTVCRPTNCFGRGFK